MFQIWKKERGDINNHREMTCNNETSEQEYSLSETWFGTIKNRPDQAKGKIKTFLFSVEHILMLIDSDNNLSMSVEKKKHL